MKVLIVGHHEVAQYLPMSECIDVMEQAFRTLHAGDAIQPQRMAMYQPDRRGVLGLMPSYLGSPGVVGAKVITVFGGNRAAGLESHQGCVMVHETEHGRLLAIVDAGAITGIRTAAISGLATRLLARADASDLAILGSGTQAALHLEAMRAVRPIRRVRVWSRTPAHAERFARELSERHGLPVTAVASAQEAVEQADIICTTTMATEPILRGEWLPPGAHVNAVGASVPPYRELDTEAVLRSRVFVDRLESALHEADDIRIPLRDGAITEQHILGELSGLVAGAPAGASAQPVLGATPGAPAQPVLGAPPGAPAHPVLGTTAGASAQPVPGTNAGAPAQSVPGRTAGAPAQPVPGVTLGRTTNDQITLFKSVGLAIEDLAAAYHVYARAAASGTGTWVEFSGTR